ncbi:MAG: hypothetical protein Q9174_002538 [Haloplaca sp. 1 TL-2023]
MITTTSNGQFVVAVTGEDKGVRVLRLELDGTLQQLNKRSMPKRPCALAFTPDEKTIICGDKFGDVYALPLFPTETSTTEPTPSERMTDMQDTRETTGKEYTPSANAKTVHTLRNQKALLHQKSRNNQKARKTHAAGEHQLLLGHVSLLTAVACVSVPFADTAKNQQRTYIITADRDEHIRISRGIPQAHVTEYFCLGHTQFVSQLCIPSWNLRFLISGGGDDFLLVWDWIAGRIVQKIDLRSIVHDVTKSTMSPEETQSAQDAVNQTEQDWSKPIAVSKLQAVAAETGFEGARQNIVMTCEGVPALFFFRFDEDCSIQHEKTVAMEANVVDFTTSESQGRIVVAMDVQKRAFWQSPPRSQDQRPNQPCPWVTSLSIATGEWQTDLDMNVSITNALQQIAIDDGEFASGPKSRPVGHESAAQGLETGRYLPEYHEAKGSNDFFACCRSPEIASTLTLQPIDRYDGLIDAAIIFSDILVIPQAMGMTVEMLDKKGPHFPNPLQSPSDGQYEEIMGRSVDVAKELDYVYQAITMTRHKLKGRVPLYGFCGAPWTLLCYMVEGGGSKLFVQVKTWIDKYPQQSKDLLKRMAELCVEYLALQVKAGAQIVQVFDSWAGELSPSSFSAFALPYLRHISKQLPMRLKELNLEPVPMVVFAKGAWYALKDLCDSGYQVVGLDWLHNAAEAMKIARDRRVVLQGNADPGVLYGSTESITAVVEEMVSGFDGGKQWWIANLGHGNVLRTIYHIQRLTRC